jgi:hypothetical protein
MARVREREGLTRRRRTLSNDPIRPARARRWELLVLAVIAFCFFFGPAMGWAAGKRPVAFENHALAAFPSVTAGGAFFSQFDAWATDHLIARRRAVALDAEVEQRAFREQPPPAWTTWTAPAVPGTGGGSTGEKAQLRNVPDYAVLQGEQNVLFYWQDFKNACIGIDPLTRGLLPVVSDLRTATEASGRRFLFTVAPDKSTVEARFLPNAFLGRDCAAARKAEMWKALAAHPPQAYVPVVGKLERTERTTSDLTYRRGDTHWNGVGSMIYAESLAEAVSPGSTAGTTLVRDAHHMFPADLSMLRGGPSHRPGLDVVPRRVGVRTSVQDTVVTVHPTVPGAPKSYPIEIWHSHATSSSAPLVQPKVVVLGDSFSEYAQDQLAPFFRDLTFVHVDSLYLAPQLALPAIRGADVVILERAERDVSGTGLLEAPGLVSRIRAMRPPPG